MKQKTNETDIPIDVEKNIEQSEEQTLEVDIPTEEIDITQTLQNKNAELEDLLIRRTAEFDNFRKRTMQEKIDLLEYGNAKVFSNLVDILDDLRNANDSAKKHQDIVALQSGLEMIYQKTDKLFTEQGVKLMEVQVGDDFDVNLHEALMRQPSDLPEEKITMILQQGYLYKDKVIKYAKVATSTGNENV